MRNSSAGARVLLVLADILSFTLAFLLAYWARMKSGYFAGGYVPLQAYADVLFFSNLMLVVLFASFSLYKIKRLSSFVDEFLAIAKALLLIFLILGAATFILKVTVFSRIVILLTFVFSTLFVSLARFFLQEKMLARLKTRCVIYKENELGKRVFKKLEEHLELGYRCVGFIRDLKEIHRYLPEAVFITTEVSTRELSALSAHHPSVEFKIVPSYTALITEPLNLNELQDIPLITLSRASEHMTYHAFKRVFDLAVSFILFIIFLPLFLLIVTLIKVTSRGPILYRHQRVGKSEQLFTCYKFRTMRIDGALKPKSKAGYLFKIDHDPRITAVGRFLRRFCLDELPQLYNVLKGDMSLVGPRPHLAQELRGLKDWQKQRFDVLPGITGLWQISGRHELSFERSMLLDLYYVKHMSFFLDLSVILKTVPAILFSRMG